MYRIYISIFLIFWASSLLAQDNESVEVNNSLPHPRIRFKDWENYIIPTDQIKEGSELIAYCNDGTKCSIISYSMLVEFFGNQERYLTIDSNIINKQALDLFYQAAPGGYIQFVNVKVQYPCGTIRKTACVFKKVNDPFNAFINDALSNSLTANFGIYYSNIRIKIEGDPKKDEIKLIQNIVNELDGLMETATIKIVNYAPTMLLRITHDSSFVWKGDFTKDIKNIQSSFFTLLKRKEITVNIKNNDDTDRRDKIIIWAILQNLADFNEPVNRESILNSPWEETAILGLMDWKIPPQISLFDKSLIKMLYSIKGQVELQNITKVRPWNIKDLTLVVLLISFLLFLVINEINNIYNFTYFFNFLKFRFLKTIVFALFIVQIPIITYSLLRIDMGDFNFDMFLEYEKYFCFFAILVSLLLLVIEKISERIKPFGLNLMVDLLSTLIAFTVCYQIVYFFTVPELLTLRLLKPQWLYVPFVVAAYQFYNKFKKRHISNIIYGKEVELAKQKEMKVKAELLTLQSKINPHFLYNALNSIAALVYIDVEKSEKMAISLAKLFRYNINKENKVYSTVAKELEMVSLYVEIEKQRFTDRLEYIKDINNKVMDCKIPISILQPLVENSIKHGVSKITGKGIIKINIESVKDNLQIKVYDNGPAFPDDMLIGFGLQSIFDKLKLLSKNNFTIRFNNLPEKHISITLKKLVK